jgi:uncharacterized membrane protein HdeD (DUF308 family)
MDQIPEFGKILVVIGIISIIVGLIFMFGSKIGIGRLPGDIFVKKDNITFYFPVVTSIIISIILTILLNIFFRK